MISNKTMIYSILAVHAAVEKDAILQELLITSLKSDDLLILKRTWRAIGADLCLRRLARSASGGASLDISQFDQRGDTFFWQGQMIGKLITLYKPPLPEEWQARIAYESLLDRYVISLQLKRQVLLLTENEYCNNFFSKYKMNLLDDWQEFVKTVFSAEELSKTFVALLNSVRLAESGGFSVLNVPIVSKSQAKILAGFYLASMNTREQGLKRLEKQISEEQERGNTDKVRKLSETLRQQSERYKPSIEDMKNLRKKYGKEFDEVLQYVSLYTPTAKGQLKVTRPVVRKFVTETDRLLGLSNFYQLPPLFMESTENHLSTRDLGDNPQNVCYICGRVTNDGFEANKIISPSPSQTLQSKSSQENPIVCGTCAALGILSPIKLSSQSFVVRLFNMKTQMYLLEDQLRLFVMGELNINAGRYVMLTCTEKIGKDSLVKEFSKTPYALWKIATLFPADVFRTYMVEAVIDGAKIVLPSRQLAWLSALMEIFKEVKTPYRINNDKSKLTKVKLAISHIQHEEVIFAIYELTKTFMSKQSGSFSPVDVSHMEDLRALHVWWLENDPFVHAERRSHMGDLMNKARFFRDVAGETGILYAFATRVRSQANPHNAEREVEKLLEKVDEPNHFIYDAAGGLQSVYAKLWRGTDTHFIYDQAKALLEEAGVEVRETIENGKPSLQFSFDDLIKVYTYLSETRYKTEKDWREFTYQVKLSLYARFPEYLGKKEE